MFAPTDCLTMELSKYYGHYITATAGATSLIIFLIISVEKRNCTVFAA